jgi:hypothetical protein
MSGSSRVPAADYNAQVLAQIRRLASEMQTALTRQAVIDQAVGIRLSRHGGSAQEVLRHLRAISQIENRKLVDVAQRIVGDYASHSIRGLQLLTPMYVARWIVPPPDLAPGACQMIRWRGTSGVQVSVQNPCRVNACLAGRSGPRPRNCGSTDASVGPFSAVR